MGVNKKVIIHMRDCSVCCSEKGVTLLGSKIVPKDYIKGTTGAGDAFCAGAIYAIYKGKEDAEILDFASSTAVMSLGGADATSGLHTEQETIEFCKKFGRLNICL